MSSLRVPGVVLVALIVVGCGSGAPASPEPTPSATPAATPGAAATVAPSPSPDVAGAFRAAFAGMSSGVMTMTGRVTVGDVQLMITATNTFSGPDSSAVATRTIGGVVTSTSTIRVAGSRFVKTGSGPWLVDTSPVPTTELGTELSRLAAAASDAGTEVRGTVTVHRLTPASGASLDPASFGMGDSGITNVTSDVVFFALDDGTPNAVAIQLAWSQPSGSSSMDGGLQVEITFSQLGQPHFIQAPAHVWPVFSSKTNAFAMAYPDDFGTSLYKGVNYFDAPSGAVVGVGRSAAPSGTTLNASASYEASLIKKNYRAVTVKNDGTTLGGVRARFLSANGTDTAKAKIVMYEVLAIKGKYLYFVFWFGRAGNEAADRATFEQMLSTFAFS
jgi:hypothetical protein